MKTKIIPFDLETAKKIQAGEIEGRIITNHGKTVTLVDAAYGFNEEYWIPIIWHWSTEHNQLVLYNSKGECRNSHSDCYLHIELSEEAPICNNPDSPICKVCSNIHCNYCQYNAPKHEFKPFDKVLVRHSDKSEWRPRLYSRKGNVGYCMQDGLEYMQILPYEGHEHLVGTTDKPKGE